MTKNTEERRRVSCAKRVAGWQDITDAIREATEIYGTVEHDDRDSNSRNKVFRLLERAYTIANAERCYCQMEDYNGCFIIPCTLKGV